MTAGAVLGLLALAAGRVPAEDRFLFDAYVPLDQSVVAAVDRAQAWLVANQRPDGGWNTVNGRNNTGEIAYATLALMVSGSVPGEGKYGKEVGMGLQFLLNAQRENGLVIGGADSANTAMYQHALATLAFSEAYGMTSSPRLRNALIRAVNLIVETQDAGGGWRYHPRPEKGDISVTVMQVMALRAAVETGIYVPKESIDRAIKFIYSCYVEKEKGFSYLPKSGGAGFARTAAGLVCLQTVGRHEDAIIPGVVEYIMQAAFDPAKNRDFYWYGNYYASIGLYHYGGDPWKEYYPKIKKKILGDWSGKANYGIVLDTSWAVLILGVPYRYLPIYQR